MEKRKINFIYWFAYYNLDSPSVRYRAKYPLDYGREKLGVKSYLILPGYTPVRILKFIRGYFQALLFRKQNSLIVIQRIHSNFIYANLLKFLIAVRSKNTVYDLDDADYLEYNPDTIHYFARRCEFISAGSESIVKYLTFYNHRVFHITSPTPDLDLVKQKRNSIFTVGWIGSFGWGHRDSLYKYVFPAIKELPFQCKFVLIGVINATDRLEIKNYFRDCNHVILEIPSGLNWNNEIDIQQRILLFDVGIATLMENPIQLAKSGIKAKQYLNNGIPVLCNNLPENNRIVKDGINGYLCNTPADFKKYLTLFNSMPEASYRAFTMEARSSSTGFNHLKYFNDLEMMRNGNPQYFTGLASPIV